jgi:hypothetical protein
MADAASLVSGTAISGSRATRSTHAPTTKFSQFWRGTRISAADPFENRPVELEGTSAAQSDLFTSGFHDGKTYASEPFTWLDGSVEKRIKGYGEGAQSTIYPASTIYPNDQPY